MVVVVLRVVEVEVDKVDAREVEDTEAELREVDVVKVFNDVDTERLVVLQVGRTGLGKAEHEALKGA